jgi:hypothetical protein
MVSLFRSHLAALEISGRLSGAHVDELHEHEVFIDAETGVLSIWIIPESGIGSWWVITADDETGGPWSMSTDGSITLDGESREMEFAVERLAAKLVKE